MTDTDAGQKKKKSLTTSLEIISRLGPNSLVGCASVSDREEKSKPIEATHQHTNKEPTPGLEDLVLSELEKLGRACQSKHMQPSMSAVRANLEKLADRVQRAQSPLTDVDSRPCASSSTHK